MPLVDLHAELHRAMQIARMAVADRNPAALLSVLPFKGRLQWGLDFVAYYGDDRARYEPEQEHGEPALIVPVVEDGDMLDLAAIHPHTQHLAMRLGRGVALGIDALAKGRCGYPVKLKARPLDWLSDPIDSVYLFRLVQLEVVLDGVRQIVCDTIEFAERVQSLLPKAMRSRVVLP